jgi:hypothetical protein
MSLHPAQPSKASNALRNFVAFSSAVMVPPFVVIGECCALFAVAMIVPPDVSNSVSTNEPNC